MCNLYRGHSIDASYQVSVHLPKGFQGRRLKCEQLTDHRPKWWQKLTLIGSISKKSSPLKLLGHMNRNLVGSIYGRFSIKQCSPFLLSDRCLFFCRWLLKLEHFVPIHKHGRRRQFLFLIGRRIKNKNCLWWSCLLTDRHELSNLYRGPSIEASYQVSIHLAKRFQWRFFRNRPIRNKNCLRRPCLWIGTK
jgi:hypothetical protein